MRKGFIIAAAFIVVAFSLSRAITTQAADPAGFSDFNSLSANDWLRAGLKYVISVDWLPGYGGTLWGVNDPIKRRDAALLFTQAIKLPLSSTPQAFGDVGATDPRIKEIDAVVRSGIMPNCSGTNFCPNDSITRGDFAAMLYRAVQGSLVAIKADQVNDPQYTDVAPSSLQINALTAAGILRGCRILPMMFCPNGLTTRGEAANFVARAVGINVVPPVVMKQKVLQAMLPGNAIALSKMASSGGVPYRTCDVNTAVSGQVLGDCTGWQFDTGGTFKLPNNDVGAAVDGYVTYKNGVQTLTIGMISTDGYHIYSRDCAIDNGGGLACGAWNGPGDISGIRGVGNERYSAQSTFIYFQGGAYRAQQSLITQDGTLGIARSCPVGGDGTVQFTQCTAWTQVPQTNLRGVGNEAYTTLDGFVVTKGGTQYLQQSMIDSAGTTGYSRVCNINENASTQGIGNCTGWTAVNQQGLLGVGNEAYQGLSSFTYLTSTVQPILPAVPDCVPNNGGAALTLPQKYCVAAAVVPTVPPVSANCVCNPTGTCATECTFEKIPGNASYSSPLGCGLPSSLYSSAPPDNKAWCARPKRTVGDANGDGVVNNIDYLYYVSAVNGAKIPGIVNPDFNGDGEVGLVDRQIIQTTITGK